MTERKRASDFVFLWHKVWYEIVLDESSSIELALVSFFGVGVVVCDFYLEDVTFRYSTIVGTIGARVISGILFILVDHMSRDARWRLYSLLFISYSSWRTSFELNFAFNLSLVLCNVALGVKQMKRTCCIFLRLTDRFGNKYVFSHELKITVMLSLRNVTWWQISKSSVDDILICWKRSSQNTSNLSEYRLQRYRFS